MLVTFVSQCEKNALKKTRRVLDAFADRIGDNTWQAIITQEGLNAVKKLLRKSVSKNTAVSCHRIRSRKSTELLWIVGSRDKFNNLGLVPVNSTRVNRTLRDDAADWHYLPLIMALSTMAALIHDWGKANHRFQHKLSKIYCGKPSDALRHEWVSCLLFQAFIHCDGTGKITDEDWLNRLAEGRLDEEKIKESVAKNSRFPLRDLPPAARLIAWLVLSHHRLPDKETSRSAKQFGALFEEFDCQWGYANLQTNHEITDCLIFPNGIGSDSKPWLRELKRWTSKLSTQLQMVNKAIDDSSVRLILHHARLGLMLADHNFSSQLKNPKWQKFSDLIANTGPDGEPKQALDEHLLGVASQTRQNIHHLPVFEKRALLSKDTNQLKRKSPEGFEWQDKAVRKIKQWLETTKGKRSGFFAINMASTGKGKTFANAKIMRVLSEDQDSLRYILALGLRTLTLQTGREYREKIFKSEASSDLAVLVGSRAIVELDAQQSKDKPQVSKGRGSESSESLLHSNDSVDYEGEIPEEGLTTVLQKPKDKAFLHAPVLACTIDHMMAATETVRGGRYILPCLRLMSSDLVIDEIDDFSGKDSAAIGRLIFLAGMLGRKVMISSATIPPAMAHQYFNAYRHGWQLFAKTRNASASVGCAWIDEFRTCTESLTEQDEPAALAAYQDQHNQFINKRIKALVDEPAKRKAEIIPTDHILKLPKDERRQAFFDVIFQAAQVKHQHHHSLYGSEDLKISFGVIRMANIKPSVALTKYLLNAHCEQHTEIRVMAYHSQQVLLLRSAQEEHLDNVLHRKEKEGEEIQAFVNPVIQQHIHEVSSKPEVKNLIFILIATPVEEVGRDHDFDWAVIEPSSYRSMIQMAGRVRRHRKGKVETPNIGILQFNWKALEMGDSKGKPCFTRPGYETRKNILFTLDDGNTTKKPACFSSHNMTGLVDEQALLIKLDATPRIVRPKDRTPNAKLARLEHAVIHYQLTDDYQQGSLNKYLNECWYLTGRPPRLSRFRESEPQQQLFLALTEGEIPFFIEKGQDGKPDRLDNGELINRESEHQLERIDLTDHEKKRLWLTRDYQALIETQAEQQGISNYYASLRYGEINLRKADHKTYFYNDQLGLFEQ